MLKAESGLDHHAAREGVWPDVSYGLAQLTVATVKGYGIGDGSDTPTNRAVVQSKLYSPRVSIDVGAHHLSGCYGQADASDWPSRDISHDLAALVIYNAGWLPPLDSRWWLTWAGNVASYKAALKWAAELVR